jgi:sulfide dehydrogenase cytochrome subunit
MSMSFATVQADDRLLASMCLTCHGDTDTEISEFRMPTLNGLAPHYFIEQMRQFQSGERKSTVMSQIANGYSADELKRLANFFSQTHNCRKH